MSFPSHNTPKSMSAGFKRAASRQEGNGGKGREGLGEGKRGWEGKGGMGKGGEKGKVGEKRLACWGDRRPRPCLSSCFLWFCRFTTGIFEKKAIYFFIYFCCTLHNYLIAINTNSPTFSHEIINTYRRLLVRRNKLKKLVIILL